MYPYSKLGNFVAKLKMTKLFCNYMNLNELKVKLQKGFLKPRLNKIYFKQPQGMKKLGVRERKFSFWH